LCALYCGDIVERVVERDFIMGEVSGVLWSPASGSDRAPLVLMGHGGGLHKKTPALMARAQDTVTNWGFTVVTVDAPGHSDRLGTVAVRRARPGHRGFNFSIARRRLSMTIDGF
jgi:hypothetical protein